MFVSMGGFFAAGCEFPRATTPPERERELTSLLELVAHQNPLPSTVPVPMAIPKGVQVGVFFLLFFVSYLVPGM